MKEHDRHDRLFIPGPTEVYPEILQQLARPQFGHRSPHCVAMVGRLREKLAPVFGTAQHVLFESCPATALMEAAIRNLVPTRSLHLTCGAFSERWHRVALACGREADSVSVEWGAVLYPDQLRAALDAKRYDAVCITHNETSTGVMNPLPELAAVLREFPDTLLLVDAVTSLAGAPLDFDRLGLDLAFASTQKCLALPAGFTVYALSERALVQAQEVPNRGWLLDFVRAAAGLAAGKPIATPSIPHLYALDAQLDRIAIEGLGQRFLRHQQMATRVRAWCAANGLRMFGDPEHLSPTTAAIRTQRRGGASLDIAALLASARDGGFVIGNGYGRLAGETFRIGHMGDHSVAELDRLLEVLEASLAR